MMRRKAIWLLSIAIVALTSSVSSSQWVKVNPFTSGSLTAFTNGQYSNSIFGISSGRLVWYTGFWTPVKSLSVTDAVCLALQSNIIYVGSNIHGLYRSTDGSGSWTDLSAKIPSRYVWALAISGKNVVAGTGDSGLLYSSDKGETWNPSTGNIGYTSIRSLYNIGYWLYACVGSDIVVSKDDGKSWSFLPYGWDRVATTAIASNGKYLYVGTRSEAVFRTSDNGAHWEGIGNGIGDSTIHALFASGDTLVEGSDKGVRISTDYGSTWSKPISAPPEIQINALGMTGWGLCASTGQGAFFSKDRGMHWQTASDGLLTTNVDALPIIATPSSIIAAFKEFHNPHLIPLVYYSTDHGNTWSKGVGMEINAVTTFTLVGNDVFAGTDSGGVFLSTDGGATWNQRSKGLGTLKTQTKPFRTVRSIAMGDGKLFTGMDGEFFGDSLVYTSNDYGLSWQEKYFPPKDSFGNNVPANGIDVIVASGSDILIRDADAKLIDSRDNGNTWDGNIYWNGYAYTDNQTPITFIGKTLVGKKDRSFIKSWDFGIHWSWYADFPYTEPKKGIIDSNLDNFTYDGANLFASNLDRLIYFSKDTGDNWIDISEGWPDLKSDYSHVLSLTVGGGYIYASIGNQHGIWARPLSEIGIGTGNGVLADATGPEVSVFPNPSDGLVDIKSGQITLSSIKLVDALGRVLVVRDDLQTNEARIDLSIFPVGTYFLYISSSEGSVIRKILRK